MKTLFTLILGLILGFFLGLFLVVWRETSHIQGFHEMAQRMVPMTRHMDGTYTLDCETAHSLMSPQRDFDGTMELIDPKTGRAMILRRNGTLDRY